MGQNTSLTSLIWLKGCSFFYMSPIVLTLNGTLSRNWCIVFNLSFPSSPCHWYFSTLATVPHTTASSGVKNIRLCPFAPLEFVRAQVAGHKTIFRIREKQEWADRVSSHSLCLSCSWQGPLRKAGRCSFATGGLLKQSEPRPHTFISRSVQLNTEGWGTFGLPQFLKPSEFSFYYYSM